MLAYVKNILQLWFSTVKLLYLPDHVFIFYDTLIRGIFTLYYLTFLAVILAVTHSALQKVVWSYVVPLAYQLEKSPETFLSFLVNAIDVAYHMLPYIVLTVAIAIIGHKLLNCVAEATVDSFAQHKGKDYPLFISRVQFLLEKTSRLRTVFIATCVGICVRIVLFDTDIYMSWTPRDPAVFRGVLLIYSACTLYGIGTFCSDLLSCHIRLEDVTSLSPHFINVITEYWWRRRTSSMRLLCIYLLLMLSVLWLVLRGPLMLLNFIVETLVCLNAPHLFIFAVLYCSTSFTRSIRSLSWLQRHPAAHLPVLLISTPHQALVLSAAFYFRCHWLLLGMFFVISVLLWTRTIDLVREFDVALEGTVLWSNAKSNQPIKPSLAVLLEDAFEKKYHKASIVSVDMQIDIKAMLIREEGVPDIPLRRTYLALHTSRIQQYATSLSFYKYVLPRLLLLQSPGSFSGRRYQGLRLLVRAVTLSGLLVFAFLTWCTVMQASFPSLRPLPVHVYYQSDDSPSLTVDHIVLRMHIEPQSVQPRTSVPEKRWGAGEQIPERSKRELDELATELRTLVQEANSTVGEKPDRGECETPPPASFMEKHSHVLNELLQTLSNASLWEEAPPTMKAAGEAYQWRSQALKRLEDKYPGLCARQFYGISVWEVSWLALAAYVRDEDVALFLEFMGAHLGTRWERRPLYGTMCQRRQQDKEYEPTGWSSFMEFYSPERDVSIISVRGTDLTSFADMLLDVNMFFEVSLYHFLANLVPGTSILPAAMVSNFIRATSLQTSKPPDMSWADLQQSAGNHSVLPECWPNNGKRDFFADVYNHILFRTRDTNPPQHVIITGHSLGGAVANIVGAKLGIQSVAFSAPGILLSNEKFNVKLHRMNQYNFNVVSTHDIVPMIGGHTGEMHHVACLAETKELCHAMEFMLGALWNSCGSIRDQFTSIRSVS